MAFLKQQALWVFYFGFVAVALITHEGEAYFFAEGPLALGKPLVWLVYLGFLAYSLYVSAHENFFKSIKTMWPIRWSRQIGIDLYLGIAIFLLIMFLHEGSILVLLAWLIPVLIFANLATLLYLALNFQSLIAHFV